MNLLFLGTGASPSYPHTFCRCSFCRELRAKGLYKRRSSLLINEDLIIDLGPDVSAASAEFGADLTRVTTILETHPHDDHFNAELLSARVPGYGEQNMPEVLLMGSSKTLSRMRERLMQCEGEADILDEQAAERMHLLVRELKPGKWVYTCRYEILPISVPHDLIGGSVIYVIRDTKDGKTLLYATDSPYFSEEIWKLLGSIRLDVAILDGTFGAGPHHFSQTHMDHREVAKAAGRLRKEGILLPEAPVYATHISHEGHISVDAMQCFARENDFLIAEDGLNLMI